MTPGTGSVPITTALPEEFAAITNVWEASVRATHHFVSEDDIRILKPLVRESSLAAVTLRCTRDADGTVTGFVGVAQGKIEMLFIAPASCGRGLGTALLTHAVDTLGATRVDVNEQNTTAVAFYRRRGFAIIDRSPLDSQGKPYPLLHMALEKPRP